MTEPRITIFTKAWKDPLPGLADTLANLGLDGVELPVRPGFQVEPGADVPAGLLEARQVFERAGMVIDSVAGDHYERLIGACGDSGVNLIRTMARIDMAAGYAASIDVLRRKLDAMLPNLERHGVTIGVQNHAGYFAGTAATMGIVGEFDPARVCCVLDMAHCALAGEPTDMAFDIAKSHVTRLVNFKNGYWERRNGPEEQAVHKVRWTTHGHGAYVWRDYVEALRRVGYSGVYCLPAEYSDPSGSGQRTGDGILPFVREDLAHLRGILASP
jgi:sugar phosphate isomerase/epimerase